jgi:hypothetical protein
MAARFPEDTTIKFLVVESLQKDVQDLPGALATVRSIAVDTASARWVTRQASVTADLLLAMGHADSARLVLAPMVEKYPENTRLKAKLDSIR